MILPGETLSSQRHPHKLTSIPVVIYSFKAYEKSDKHAIDPTEISWPDDMGGMPAFYNSLADCAEPEKNYDEGLLLWMLRQLIGPKVACCLNLLLS